MINTDYEINVISILQHINKLLYDKAAALVTFPIT